MQRTAQGVLFALALAARTACAQSPCDGVDRSLTNENKVALAPVIAKQLRAQKVDVMRSFRFESWSIFYVDSHESDDVFLFYAHDPLRTRYVTLWSGAALEEEEQSVKTWTLKNVPGIPPKLAACFAWHVTKDRDR